MSETLWDAVLARVEAKINRHSFATWFRPTLFLSRDAQTLRIGVPNAQFREWLSKNYLGVLQEALTEVGSPELRVVFEEISDEPAPRLQRPGRPSGETEPPQPEVHLRELRRRLLEPVRARRRPRRRRDPLEVLQPALHLRRRRPRQDPPDARDRPLHPGPREAPQRPLHLDRSLHQRDDQRDPLRPPARLPPEVPRDRRAARRRHPVHRRQGPHAGGVLPHLQRPARLAEADRGQLRLPAAPDPHHRGAPAQPLRVGPDRRHPAPRHRDQGRDPAQEGRGRARRGARRTWRCSSPARCARTSASSRAA